MYIPVSYWQTGGGVPHALACYFATPFQGNFKAYTYVFDATTINATTNLSTEINKNCIDLYTFNSVITGGTFLSPAGGLFFCSAKLIVGPGQCCINTPPETGPEAWYIDIIYRIPTNEGALYYNYIDQFGNIINDTITFAQNRKRIISQVAPLWFRQSSNLFNFFMSYDIVEKFPGQVTPYPFKDIPTTYTFTAMRPRITQPAQYAFPNIKFTACSLVDGFPIASNNGSTRISAVISSIGDTINVVSSLPPLDTNDSDNCCPNTVWITDAVPLAKGALNLTSCTTTHSLWVTLNNYDYYPTGSVLKVTNPQLIATSSCWTVTNLSSSVSVPVYFTNTNISESLSTCFICLSGSITSSLNVEYLLVAGAGGGGAGNSGNGPGAGGGAGGLLSGSYTLIPKTTHSIIIGNGGGGGKTNSQTGLNGQNSSIFSLNAIGGGGGASSIFTSGSNGGSGGGSGASFGTAVSGGLGTIGQGNNGGPGGSGALGGQLAGAGGGGGASNAGTQWIYNPGPGYLSFAGSGGSGSQWLDGNYYAGGGSGGGGSSFGINPGTPGIGGGGTGGNQQFGTLATPGQTNRGGGGGGGASPGPITGASGSAGVCIVRYPGTTQLIGGGNVTFSGSYVYHTFTSSTILET